MKITLNQSGMKNIALGMGLILFNVACTSDTSTVTDETVQIDLAADQVVVSSEQFDHGKMTIGGFEEHTFNEVIRSTGMMDVPPENKSTVSAYFGGYVKTIHLIPGQFIKKGQVLFILENPAYIETQQSFLEAKSELSYLKADYERQKTLSADQVSSEKTFLKAQSDYEMTLARYESLKKKLELMNINPSQITAETMRSTIAVNSPISGYITAVNASMGMFLNPSDPAVTIMNTDHLHIELSIFEKNLSQIKVGQEVNFTIQNDLKQHKAEVYLINRAIDPESRTVRVHCHLSDESLMPNYTPGMFVEASIVTNGSTALALPETAVINSENADYVLVKLNQDTQGEYHYQKVIVQAGLHQDGLVQILNAASFEAGTQFLTNGAFNLITE